MNFDLHIKLSSSVSCCHIGSSCLLVTEQLSKKQFLVDTGSDLCVLSCSFLSPRKLDPNFQLKASNNSTIKTYGFLTLPLDLGLRRHFSWRFVIADVPLPIIGSDFRAHFGLLPDCKHELLLDRITSLSVREQSTGHSMLSIKIVSGESTPYDHFLKKYLTLTRPADSPFLILHFIIYKQLRVLQSFAVLDALPLSE
ncbi:uncharacterized protein TNCV_2808011 [Trichonephila clavipes]|nr:uncharacterized protein TNCV_2808011 [Trichonephila clavipes]